MQKGNGYKLSGMGKERLTNFDRKNLFSCCADRCFLIFSFFKLVLNLFNACLSCNFSTSCRLSLKTILSVCFLFDFRHSIIFYNKYTSAKYGLKIVLSLSSLFICSQLAAIAAISCLSIFLFAFFPGFFPNTNFRSTVVNLSTSFPSSSSVCLNRILLQLVRK